MCWASSIMLAIALGYGLLILAFWRGWQNLSGVPLVEHPGVKLSIVIPFRNEAANLPVLLEQLKKQSLPAKQFEIIWVDDHSSDGSAECIRDYPAFVSGCILSLKQESGKKSALHKGILASRNPFIVTTDADTLPHTDWLLTIARYFAATGATLLLGPVAITGNDLFSRLQALEFSSLQASTAGAAGLNMPVMANGANLAFSRSAYMHVQETLPGHIASGDDIFLLHAIKRHPGYQIGYIRSARALVQTYAASSLRAFIRQRVRWTSKSTHYRDVQTIITAMLVAGTAISLLAALGSGIGTGNWWLLLSLFLLKSVPDAFLLFSYNRFYHQAGLMKWFIPLQFCYPFYILFTSLSLFRPRFNWKARKHASP